MVTSLRGLAKFFKEGQHTKTIDKKGSILPKECVCVSKSMEMAIYWTLSYMKYCQVWLEWCIYEKE